eukprot:5447900-Alexandrium_andersonii.AAC.1
MPDALSTGRYSMTRAPRNDRIEQLGRSVEPIEPTARAPALIEHPVIASSIRSVSCPAPEATSNLVPGAPK